MAGKRKTRSAAKAALGVMWTTREVAAQLRVDRKTVHRLIRDGQLRAVRIGPTMFRIPEAALRALRDAPLPPNARP